MPGLPKELETFSFAGFLGVSTLDYPGRVASVLFTQGCNAHCHYCHNRMMIPQTKGAHPAPLVLQKVRERVGFVDGVVVSGGEPTIHPQLEELLRYLKETGCAVKLDTNGIRADVIESILKRSLVDYVAMDLKTTLDRYPELTTEEHQVARSIDLIAHAGVRHEFRTTCDGRLITPDNIGSIAGMVPKGSPYILQEMTGADQDMEILWECARQKHDNPVLRGKDARVA